MRILIPYLLGACAGPGLPSDGLPPPLCDEVVDPIAGSEMSWLGVSPNGLRIVAGKPTTAPWRAGGEVGLGVRWPGGLSTQVFATLNDEANLSPEPLWCVDRVELPAQLQLQKDDSPTILVSGQVRAAGPTRALEVAFVGAAPAAQLSALLPPGIETGLELDVWAWLDPDAPNGQLRDPQTGEVYAEWGVD